MLVNNASIRRQTKFSELTVEEWREILGATLDGAFYCVHAAAPHILTAGGGSIVNLGGISAHLGAKGRVHAVTAKAGMMGLTDTQHVLGPGLKALRWLIIGHRPDFVRERSIEYQFETISQKTIGTEAWTDCIKTAFISAGKAENFVETTAQAFYNYSRDIVPAIDDPALTLQALSNAIVKAINRMLGTGA